MEFLLGLLVGGACVIFLLVRWANAKSTPAKPPTTGFEYYSYDTIIQEFQKESESVLRELQEAISARSKKRK